MKRKIKAISRKVNGQNRSIILYVIMHLPIIPLGPLKIDYKTTTFYKTTMLRKGIGENGGFSST